VLFDKTGAAEPTSFDRQAHSRKIAARRSAIAARHALFSHTVEKELARGHSHDALLFHQRFVVDPLVELLRMRHCPERFDFGARYLWRDLPTDVAARVERLAFVCDRDDLDRKRQEGIAWIAELLAQDASASAG
jgi:hypothetical protein